MQSQSVSSEQSVIALSPFANVVTPVTQSVAAPHPANLVKVFKEMMDAAEMNQTVVLTMDEIEAEYKHRQEALIRPASPLPSHTTTRSSVLSNSTVKAAQVELQLDKTKMAAL